MRRVCVLLAAALLLLAAAHTTHHVQQRRQLVPFVTPRACRRDPTLSSAHTYPEASTTAATKAPSPAANNSPRILSANPRNATAKLTFGGHFDHVSCSTAPPAETLF